MKFSLLLEKQKKKSFFLIVQKKNDFESPNTNHENVEPCPSTFRLKNGILF